MAFGTEVASLHAVLSLDDSQFNSGLKNADGSLSRFDRSMGGVVSKWQDFGRAAQVASIPIGIALGKGIADASAFESAMAEISARTGLVGDDLTAVRNKALQMGADTMFSGQQAAEGMLQLLTSGDSIEEAMMRIESVMALATIGNMDLGTAADGLTDIMAATGTEILQTKDMVDLLAMATGASSATVQSLLDGFANVGPVARTFGLSAYDQAAALAVLSENGIKGSEAGTALKSMLLNMTKTTDETTGAWNTLGLSFYDASGNARDFNDIINDLDAALNTKTPQEQNELMKALGGSYGIVALSALRASGGIGNMDAAMQKAAQSDELVAAKSGTFAFALDALGGSVETLNIKAFTPFMNDVLKPIVGDFTDVINKVGDFAEANPELTNTVLGVALAFVAGTAALSGLGIGINLVTTGIAALITTALSPLGVALAFGAVLVAAYLNNWMGFKDWVDGTLRPTILGIINDLRAWEGVMGNIQTIVSGIQSGKYSVADTLDAAKNAVVNEIQTANPSGFFNIGAAGNFANTYDHYQSMTGNNGMAGPQGQIGSGTIQLLNGSGTRSTSSVNINQMTINAQPGQNGADLARDFRQELIRRGGGRG